MILLAEQIAAPEREIAMRRHVYGRKVDLGRTALARHDQNMLIGLAE